MKPCPTCARLGRACTMCQHEAERAKRLPPHGVVNPLSRTERDKTEASHG
jgi:hypothetical protein